MSESDFHFEFYSDVPHLEYELRWEADNRLRKLATDQTDMIGGAVAVEELTQGEDLPFYRAQVIVYTKPHPMAAVRKDDSIEVALCRALDAVEQQLRACRDKAQR